jgi:peptidoglycan hydrolase-like protein with peptidoglycan-binding domain
MGTRVAAAQRALIAADIFVRGGAQGWFNADTRAAVARFQRQRGLPVTGSVDIKTARALGLLNTAPTPWAQLGVGSVGTAVLRAERALMAAGFRAVRTPNSTFGVGTYVAVTNFQKSRGLPATGIIDLNTARALGLLGAPATAQVSIMAAAADSAPTTTAVRVSTTTSTTTTTAAASTSAGPSTTMSSTTTSEPPPTSTPIAAVGDFVWLDASGNGLQDPDERGIEGVAIALLDATGVELARDVTDQFGGYEFTVEDGSYFVELTLPPGHGIAQATQGLDDTHDSNLVIVDEQRATARTELVAVPGARLDGIDLGLIVLPDDPGETTTTTETTDPTEVSSTDVSTTEVSTTTTTEVPTTAELPTTMADTTVSPTTAAPTTSPPPNEPPTTALDPTTTAAG